MPAAKKVIVKVIYKLCKSINEAVQTPLGTHFFPIFSFFSDCSWQFRSDKKQDGLYDKKQDGLYDRKAFYEVKNCFHFLFMKALLYLINCSEKLFESSCQE